MRNKKAAHRSTHLHRTGLQNIEAGGHSFNNRPFHQFRFEHSAQLHAAGEALDQTRNGLAHAARFLSSERGTAGLPLCRITGYSFLLLLCLLLRFAWRSASLLLVFSQTSVHSAIFQSRLRCNRRCCRAALAHSCMGLRARTFNHIYNMLLLFEYKCLHVRIPFPYCVGCL